MKLDHRPALIACFLAIATLAVYLPVAGLSFIYFDDPVYVFENPQVLAGLTWKGVVWAFTHSHGSNWHPLTWISHMLDCQVYGLNAGGHHATNLLFHTANTVLLFGLLRRLTGSLWRSAVAAALFALHPLHVESVAWVAERKDVLSLFFGLLSLHAYVSYATERSRRREEADSCQRPSNSPLPNTPNGPLTPTLSPSEGERENLLHPPLGLAVPSHCRSGRGEGRPSSLAVLRRVGGVGLPNRSPSRYYALTFLLFAFALMSKPMLVTLPLLMLLLDFWPLRRFQPSTLNAQLSTPSQPLTNLVREKLPFFLLSAASSVITFQVQKAGGAVAALQQLPLAARASNALVSYVRYLAKLFWPSDLAVLYPFQGWPLSLTLVAVLALACVTLLTIWQRQKRPYLLVGWAWYIVSLLPVIGLVQVGAQSIADRYTYLPCIGLCIALAWGVSDALRARRSGNMSMNPEAIDGPLTLSLSPSEEERVSEGLVRGFGTPNCEISFRGTVALLIGATPAVIALALVTQKQISHWQNTERLFTHAISVTSRNALAYNTLGRYFATFNEWRQAEQSYRTAIKIDPGFQQAWNNLGCALIDQGRNEEALTNCQIAIQLGPSFAEAHNNLGTALLNQGKTDQAVLAYSEALKLRPDYEQAHYNLGNALALKGRIPEAREQYQAALEINPRSASAHSNCGFMLAKEGNFAQATMEFRSALELDPTLWQAHYGLGDALARLGQHSAAASEFIELLRIRPSDAGARYQLAICQEHMRSTEVEGLRPTKPK